MTAPTSDEKATLQIVVLTGMSGSGKSCALKSLEDLGFFCVDNLPPRFLPDFFKACRRWTPDLERIAVTVDIRERAFLLDFPRVYHRLQTHKNIRTEVLFLEASEETLLRRFKETRRPHPLAFNRPVVDGIREEKSRLAEIRVMADRMIDTSALSVHQLRRFINQAYGGPHDAAMVLQFVSFGYRFGLPFNADLVWDARFLRNPYFDDDLREKTGLDPDVRRFVLEDPTTHRFLSMMSAMLRYLLPKYQEETKHYLTVAVGCTGGHHRSVVLVECLARRFSKRGWHIEVEHRDLTK